METIVRLTVLLAVAMLIGCSKEDAAQSFDTASAAIGSSQRDKAIKSWQRKVADEPRCNEFRDRFFQAGSRHDSGYSYDFNRDMMQVWDAVKASDCQHSP